MKPGNYRWRILILLFFATTINYIDRQVIGILKPFIAEDLSWSESDYGYIVAAFQLAYGIGLIMTGRVLDRFGTRIGYFWAMIIWSIAGMAHAAARGASSFAVARFALGFGESANFPAAIKCVAEWFPKKERAFATGLFNSGSTIGAITAPIIVSWLTMAFGWQWAFIVTGAFGFIWVVFWLAFYKLPQQHPRVTPEELQYILQDTNTVNSGNKISWLKLFKYQQTFAICLTRFISDWVWWFFLFWTPDFLNKTHGVDLKNVVLPLIVIYAISNVGGIAGGWISSRFLQQGRSAAFARKTTVLFCAMIVLPVVMVPQIQHLWTAVILIALAAACHQGWASNIFTIVSDIYPKNAVASMIGLSGFAGAIGGTLAAPFVGLLLERTGSYFLIFLCAAVVYMINWLILMIFIPERQYKEISCAE